MHRSRALASETENICFPLSSWCHEGTAWLCLLLTSEQPLSAPSGLEPGFVGHVPCWLLSSGQIRRQYFDIEELNSTKLIAAGQRVGWCCGNRSDLFGCSTIELMQVTDQGGAE